jgi:hypothetical protein
MWRKGILLQFLVPALLLGGAAQARQPGPSSDLVLGRAVPEPGVPSRGQDGFARWGGRRGLASFRSGLGGDGDVGSHIDPDGGRLRATVDPNG